MADTVYRITRWRPAFVAALCAIWFAGSYWLFQYGTFVRSVPMGFLGMLVSGCYIFAYAMLALFPTRLILTDEGFDLHHWTAREQIAWRDIGPLSVWGVGRTAMVVYNYLPGKLPVRLSLLHRINHSVGNFDGSLPSNLPTRNTTLCAKMNERRERAVGG